MLKDLYTSSVYSLMKHLLLAICLLGSTTHLSHSDPATTPSTADLTSSELARLQTEFDRKRTEALRPVHAWYRTRLEELQKKLENESSVAQAEVNKALASQREAFWRDDQPELVRALVTQRWLWRSEDDASGVPVAFHAEGAVDHIGLKGTWRITGPSEVTIHTTDDEQFVVRFNASLTAYEADYRKVLGIRESK